MPYLLMSYCLSLLTFPALITKLRMACLNIPGGASLDASMQGNANWLQAPPQTLQ